MIELLLAAAIATFVCWLLAAFVIAWVGAACAEDDDHTDRDARGEYPRKP